MPKKVLVILGLIFVIGGVITIARLRSQEDGWICQNGTWIKHGNPSGPSPTGTCNEGEKITPNSSSNSANLPNPASQNCLDHQGRLEALEETAGTLNICKFPDGSECEEWQFYRGECQKGQTTKADTSHPYRGWLSKKSGNYFFKSETGVEYNLQVPSNAPKELLERLDNEAMNGGVVTILAAENPPLSKKLTLKSFLEK